MTRVASGTVSGHRLQMGLAPDQFGPGWGSGRSLGVELGAEPAIAPPTTRNSRTSGTGAGEAVPAGREGCRRGGGEGCDTSWPQAAQASCDEDGRVHRQAPPGIGQERLDKPPEQRPEQDKPEAGGIRLGAVKELALVGHVPLSVFKALRGVAVCLGQGRAVLHGSHAMPRCQGAWPVLERRRKR